MSTRSAALPMLLAMVGASAASCSGSSGGDLFGSGEAGAADGGAVSTGGFAGWGGAAGTGGRSSRGEETSAGDKAGTGGGGAAAMGSMPIAGASGIPTGTGGVPDADGGPDVAMNLDASDGAKPPSNCQALHTTNPSAGSGQYTIDPGTGPVSVYCDMAFNDGTGAGGWTLVESIRANNSPSNTVAGVVTPGTTIAMPLSTVKALAALSTQVHIRTPEMASTQSITSVANSSPIVHLRAGNILNDLGDSQQYQNWTGPYATSAYLNFSCATAGYTWPTVYWACGNVAGLTLVTSWSEWKWSDYAQEPFEIYVR